MSETNQLKKRKERKTRRVRVKTSLDNMGIGKTRFDSAILERNPQNSLQKSAALEIDAILVMTCGSTSGKAGGRISQPLVESVQSGRSMVDVMLGGSVGSYRVTRRRLNVKMGEKKSFY